jgi:hypothetical protein
MLSMSNLNAKSDDAARAVFRVTGECVSASEELDRLAPSNSDRNASERVKYEHHLIEAIGWALRIEDEFYKGLAIHRIISVCRKAHELDIAKTLFREVDHPSLREQIVRDAPELAGERRRLADEEGAVQPITILLDGLDREAVARLVIKTIRDNGACEREVEGFKQDVAQADYDTTLAKAIDWGAPVHFVKDGEPWLKGDWRRLNFWQRINRWMSLWGGSYMHPDGTIELASEDKH